MASNPITRQVNGKQLIHNPNAKGSQPRYIVTDENGVETRPKGVTTILAEVLAKDFVGWALDMFESAILQRLNSLLDEEPLTEEDVAHAKQAAARKRDSGASTGSETHAMVEAFLKAEDVSLDHSKEALNAFGAFVKWFEEVKPEVIGVEQTVYSDMYKYAGCYDALLKIDGKVYLCDLKTTNASRKAPLGIYPEHFIQLGAYAGALIEEGIWDKGLNNVKIDGLMVISAKKDGKLDIVTRDDVDWCAQAFRDIVSIRNFMLEVKKKLGG